MRSDSEKLDAVFASVTRLEQSVSGRGGVLDRLERVEATTDYHRTLLWRASGVVMGVSAFFSFLGAKLGTVLAALRHS